MAPPYHNHICKITLGGNAVLVWMDLQPLLPASRIGAETDMLHSSCLPWL